MLHSGEGDVGVPNRSVVIGILSERYQQKTVEEAERSGIGRGEERRERGRKRIEDREERDRRRSILETQSISCIRESRHQVVRRRG